MPLTAQALAGPTTTTTPPSSSGTDGVDQLIDSGIPGSDWLKAAVIVGVAVVLAIVVARTSRKLLGRVLGKGFAASVVSRLLAYVIVLIGLVYALNSLGVRVGPLLGALGLGGLVIALALQEVAENFVGALIIQARRPFTIGDTVTIGDHTGVVVDVDARTTVLRGFDGSSIRIPNRDVLGSPTVTLTRESTRRSQVVVGLDYAADLEQAVTVLHEALATVDLLAAEPAPLVQLRRFGPSTIDVELLFWHASDIPAERNATHDVILAVHRALGDAGITIAFPQVVVWNADRPADGI